MAFLEISEIMQWQEFVQKFQNHQIDCDRIFRGQSNGTKRIALDRKDAVGRTVELVEWNLESSFNRYYDPVFNYDFRTFITQQLQEDLFKIYYANYKPVQNTSLSESDLMNKIYFLQHYGCPTCLMDFTTDPLIALYFSVSGLKGSTGHSLNSENNVIDYTDDSFVSVYELDCKVLREVGVKDVNENEDLGLSYDDYKILPPNSFGRHAFVGLISSPKFNDNYNLQKQNGCFVFYDNGYYRGKAFDEFMNEYVTQNSLTEEIGIYKHRISCNSIFRNHHLNKESLFSFLKRNNVYGAELFNDLQGLKYDFNFFLH